MIEDIKEYMKGYVKEYYANNKEEIVRKRQEKMVCSKCGKTVTRQAKMLRPVAGFVKSLYIIDKSGHQSG
jgi:ribosomal protein S27AE